MGLLTLVRHSQASFFSDDYDQLSDLGRRQAEHLGDYWLGCGTTWTRVIAGPLKRQRHTQSIVCEAYQAAGVSIPEVDYVDSLDEHHAPEVVRHVLEQNSESTAAPFTDGAGHRADQENFKREYFRKFEKIALEWVAGTASAPGAEEFRIFKDRVSEFLSSVVTGVGKDERVVAFTSGGVISMAVALVLGLPDNKLFDLNFVVRNTSITEIRFSSTRRSLESFNGLPHLRDADMQTLV